MNTQDSLIDQLVEAFRCLPGIGPKTAQRLVWYLLERDREGGVHLSDKLRVAMESVGHCDRCRNFTEQTRCHICEDPRRDETLLCIVENPADIAAIEQSASFKGFYFVTMGCLSPIDGIGPDELGLPQLKHRCSSDVSEVILAMGSSVEAEATVHYISEMLRRDGLLVSRIAHGIPVGGELEYIDSGTLAHALQGRKNV